MFALSIRQPWVERIITGEKPVEFRRWRTDFRGVLILHAAKTADQGGAGLQRGGFVGAARLVRIEELDDGTYGWHLADAMRLPRFVPGPGRLSLFRPPTSIEGLLPRDFRR